MAKPLRPNPPPPLERNGPSERWKKRLKKKFIFSLMALPFTLPPLNGQAIKRRTFFVAASLREYELYDFNFNSLFIHLGKPQKKVLLLMARPSWGGGGIKEKRTFF